MKAEIVAVGTEILLGEIVDTNSAFIARELPELGIDLYYKTVVGDNMGRIVETFERAWNRADIVITTGGLGPTADDMTREGVAAVLGETPYVDPGLEERVRAFFQRRGAPMPESNIKQAWLIPSARVIDNPRGTAPGWWVERDGHNFVSMPGVPSEMERMWLKEVRPELEKRATGEVLVTRTLKTLGIGEGSVDEMARPVYSLPGIGVGTYARADGVHIRIGAKAASRAEALALIAPAEERLDAIFGKAIWGRDDDSLEAMLAATLRSRGETLATLESGTAGAFASVIAGGDDASHFAGGMIVAHHGQIGPPVLDLPRPFTHNQAGAEMAAQAVAARFGADYGLAISAGLEPGIPETEQADVHIGLAGPGGANHAMSFPTNQGRALVKRRSVMTSLLLLRRALSGELG